MASGNSGVLVGGRRGRIVCCNQSLRIESHLFSYNVRLFGADSLGNSSELHYATVFLQPRSCNHPSLFRSKLFHFSKQQPHVGRSKKRKNEWHFSSLPLPASFCFVERRGKKSTWPVEPQRATSDPSADKSNAV